MRTDDSEEKKIVYKSKKSQNIFTLHGKNRPKTVSVLIKL